MKSHLCLFQTKQTQFPQLFLTSLISKSLHQPHCSSLHMFEQLNVLLVVSHLRKSSWVALIWPFSGTSSSVSSHGTSKSSASLLGRLPSITKVIPARVVPACQTSIPPTSSPFSLLSWRFNKDNGSLLPQAIPVSQERVLWCCKLCCNFPTYLSGFVSLFVSLFLCSYQLVLGKGDQIRPVWPRIQASMANLEQFLFFL